MNFWANTLVAFASDATGFQASGWTLDDLSEDGTELWLNMNVKS